MDLRGLRPNTFTLRCTSHSPEELWPLISNPLLAPAWSPELQEIRILGSRDVGLGTQFEGDQLRGERRWTSISTVTRFEPSALFEWTVGDVNLPVSRWAFLVDHTQGVTTVTHRVTLCGGPSPMSDVIAQNPESAEVVVRERLELLRDRMGVTLDGLVGLLA